MIDLQQQFTVHPIGQGFFYTGFLEVRGARFDMVFDCGSKNPNDLSREIGRYRHERDVDKYGLDLLVISHFDNDHVSGIDELLKGVKVRRLVLPFLNFRERLYLVARTLITGRGYKSALDFTLRLMIDPLGTLRDHLDGDSEVFFVQDDPKPIGPDDENEPSESRFNDNELRLVFDYQGKTGLDIRDINLVRPGTTKAALYKVKDRNKGHVDRYAEWLMDFLFYKKSLGAGEENFYQEVVALFFARYGLSETSSVEEIVAEVRKIRSAPPIRELFNKAKRKWLPADVQVDNLNITALCLLHLNKPALYRLTNESNPWFECGSDAIYHFKNHARVLFSHAWPGWWYAGYYPQRDEYGFPNVLLTSDTVLLDPADVAAFEVKYRHYLDRAWLVQIPHHGSRHNSDEPFFNLVQQPYRSLFVNYGLNNSFGHPSEDIMDHIRGFLVPVHERQGMRFYIAHLS